VDEGAIPGAVLCVVDGARVVETLAVGATTEATAYDLASLTKPLCTTTLSMQGVAKDELDLDAPAAQHLPQLAHSAVTFRQLLSHTSGLPAWRPLYEQIPPGPDARAAMIAAAGREPLETNPGERQVYSDLGFILLGAALERIAGARLDALFADRVARPLGLGSSLAFVDLARGERRLPPVAPTELDATRGLIEGEVHDENAWRMGGVAGHAGLFGTAVDVATVAAALLDAFAGRASTLTAGAVVQQFFAPPTIPGATFGLGWDHPSRTGYTSAGTRWPRDGVGHLAFTGCSLWMDPSAGRAVVLLTNRVHPTRNNEAIRPLRPEVHDAVCADLGWY
jgi:CubicO group peptidase (beta-lactamase class C family)